MTKKQGYAGRIQNSGSQSVKAPIPMPKKGGSIKRSGEDLQSGK